MKQEDRLSEPPLEALRAMRSAVPVEDAEFVAKRRVRLVDTLEDEIIAAGVRKRRGARMRRFLQIGALAAGVAGLVASGVVLREHMGARSVVAVEAPLGAGVGAESRALLVQASGVTLRTQGHDGQAHDAKPAPVSSGFSLTPGSELETLAAGWLEMELPSRARVEMSEKSRLSLQTLTSAEQHMTLALGRIDVSVPKPQPGIVHRLVIVTPDSEVEVRGTVFSVEVRPSHEDPSRLVTEVFVSRGAVAVRHAGTERLIAIGGHFRSDEASDSAPLTEAREAELIAEARKAELGESAAGESATAVPATGDSGKAPSSVTTARGATVPGARSGNASSSAASSSAAARGAVPSSTLGEQNRMFEQALAARDRGDLRGAVVILDQLLSRYPSSPLIGSVRTERSRVLTKLDSAH